MPSPAPPSLLSHVRKAVSPCGGQTVVDYALIVGVISIGVAILLTGFGQALIISAEEAIKAVVP